MASGNLAARLVLSLAIVQCCCAFHSSSFRISSAPSNELKPGSKVNSASYLKPLASIRGGAAGLKATLTPEFVMGTLAPLCGNIIGNLMFLAPMPSVLAARKSGKLGELNPMPFPSLIGNCAAWIAYGLVVKNMWIIAPNISGILIGLFYTISTYLIAPPETKSTMVKTLAAYAAIIAVPAAAISANLISTSPKTVFGLVANLLLLIFYASPLASLATVVRTRNAASLDPLLAGSGFANGAFWLVYGYALRDGYVAIPNGIGAVLNALNLAAVAAFGRRPKTA